MKKTIGLAIISIIAVFGLTACGPSGGYNSGGSGSSSSY